MTEKFIPYEKMSKKQRRELDAKARNLWGADPRTRVVPNGKAYKRKPKHKAELEY
ncbi:hypothetical protein [Ruminococcus sp.]|uniref:hypothetical protein n=1 Tax=Ruminococcus sp. TaxID=41978 RepID=UPI0025F18034|nr:hypothetical protein [Ruminococcus sp.]MBQ8967497.1 hypothetical protein [Ruminococcus sp.]